MKIPLLFSILFFAIRPCFAQETDYQNMVDKAKLLTLHRFGMQNIDSIIREVIEQEDTVYSFSWLKNTYFIVISYEQDRKYYNFQPCHFYLAYSETLETYYRLGGFESDDIDSFFDQVFDKEIMEHPIPETTEIDFACLRQFRELTPRKRLRKEPCYPVVENCVTFKIIVD